ncbi:MAG: LapA family protein [Desulfatitalea sp.]|nr:LapA family protein [Desulfatitalea sp.]
MTKVKLVAALVLAILAIIVVFQNMDPVATQLLFITIEMPRAAMLALTLLVGIAIGVFATLVVSARRNRGIKESEPEDDVRP